MEQKHSQHGHVKDFITAVTKVWMHLTYCAQTALGSDSDIRRFDVSLSGRCTFQVLMCCEVPLAVTSSLNSLAQETASN